MKKISLFVLLLITPFFAISQSVKIRKGQATVDKEPYCLIEAEGLLVQDYTIKALDDTELFFVKRELVPTSGDVSYVYYTITNLLNEEQFEIDQQLGSAIKIIIKNMYKNEVIVDNTISEKGLKKYKLKHAGNFKEKYEAIANRTSKPTVVVIDEGQAEDYELTERNRNATIYVFGKTIKQGTTEIGSYSKDIKSAKGKIIHIYTIYDINNRLIARAEKEQFGETATYVTLKDNRKRTISVSSNLETNFVKSLVNELVEYLYL